MRAAAQPIDDDQEDDDELDEDQRRHGGAVSATESAEPARHPHDPPEPFPTRPSPASAPAPPACARRWRSSSSRTTSRTSCSRCSTRSRATPGQTLVLGGDGRYLNEHRDPDHPAHGRGATASAASSSAGRGILSTPAASCVISKRAAFGGIILSASHNPGGPDGDFGIKYNAGNGGPAPERITEAVWKKSEAIERYRTLTRGPHRPRRGIGMHAARRRAGRGHRSGGRPRRPDGRRCSTSRRSARCCAAARFRMRFDAMNAVTGPYARRDLRRRLGAPAGSVIDGRPLPDFGGDHPDPNPVYAADADRGDVRRRRARLRRRQRRRRRPQHDRRPPLRRHAERQPRRARRQRPPRARLRRRPQGHRPLDADQPRRRPRRRGARHRLPRDADRLEVLRQPARRRPGDAVRRGKLRAPAPTTCARRTASGRCCSGSTSSPRAGESVEPIVREHWRRFGRDVYSRHDYEGVDATPPNGLMAHLRTRLAGAAGTALRLGDGSRALVAAPTTSPTPTRSTARYDRAGHPHRLRRRLAHRLPPLGHRHRRRDPARLPRALRARSGAPRRADAGSAGAADRGRRGDRRHPRADRPRPSRPSSPESDQIVRGSPL